ncbi:NAD(P)-dependent oxidoreductase [Catenuloplanes japonicus]|uniref:NAD(P)-dependent oxidoreductase n=1 Tax=Catenuloplanes japonicus TaxID=33876 RepID=UPI000527D416|nr:NAD(P)-binding domain-containing protein [Catenuloplanes japonicus]
MARIGFIGLGIMGSPMAANLLKAGHEIIGYDRSAARLDQLSHAGGRPASSLKDAVTSVDVVITMLPDSPDVASVATGIAAHGHAGQLWIDTSSIAPATARDAAAAVPMPAVDAPVSGGEQGAVDGTLSIMAGGPTTAFARAKPLLDVVGGTVVHVGPSGAGQTVKLANQLIVAGVIELVAEAIVFLEAYGVDTDAAVRVLAGGLAGNRILDRKAAGMLARSFVPGFRVDLHHKDLGNLTAAARDAGVAIPLGAMVAQLIGALRAQGHGDLDHSALLLLVEQLSTRTPAAVDPGSGEAV